MPNSPASSFPALPRHLSGQAATGLQEGEVVAQYELGSQRNFIYLIIDWSTRVAAIVDPQSDLKPPLADLAKHGVRLERVLLTHTHFDHIAGLGQLARDLPGIPVHVHADDEYRIAKDLREKLAIRHARDGDDIAIGELKIRAMHTPGHSAGECSYFIEGVTYDRASRKPSPLPPPYLLTGDTIFIRDCGRTDFEDGSNEQMFASLQRVKGLPPETVILPGHHYKPECASTVGRESIESPPFRCATVAELEALP